MLADLEDRTFIILSSSVVISSRVAIAAIKRRFQIPGDVPLKLETDLHYEHPDSILWDDEE